MTDEPTTFMERAEAFLTKTGRVAENPEILGFVSKPPTPEEFFSSSDSSKIRQMDFSGVPLRTSGRSNLGDPRVFIEGYTGTPKELEETIVIVTAKRGAPSICFGDARRLQHCTVEAGAVMILNGYGRVLFFGATEPSPKYFVLDENGIRIASSDKVMSKDELRSTVCDYIHASRLVCGWHLWFDLCSLNIAVNRAKIVNLSTHPALRTMARQQLASQKWLDQNVRVAEFWENAEIPMSLLNFARVMTHGKANLRVTT